jgi:hypothetical protein
MFRVREISHDSHDAHQTASFLVEYETAAECREHIKARYIDYCALLASTGYSSIVTCAIGIYPVVTPGQLAASLNEIQDYLYEAPAGVTVTISTPTLCGYRAAATLEIFNLVGRYGPREDDNYPEIADEDVQDPMCPCKNPVCDGGCGTMPCGVCIDVCRCGVWIPYRGE